jgi:hypothetical protein
MQLLSKAAEQFFFKHRCANRFFPSDPLLIIHRYSCRVSNGNDELSRNYASNECGSKIIAANPEAEGTFKVSTVSLPVIMHACPSNAETRRSESTAIVFLLFSFP